MFSGGICVRLWEEAQVVARTVINNQYNVWSFWLKTPDFPVPLCFSPSYKLIDGNTTNTVL
jgi:hypothetical protein